MFRDICFALPPPQPPPRAYTGPKLAQVKPGAGEKVVPKNRKNGFQGSKFEIIFFLIIFLPYDHPS